MRHRINPRALAAIVALAGCAGRSVSASPGPLLVPCPSGGIAGDLRDRVADLLVSTDPDERELVDSVGLRAVARQHPQVVRDPQTCDRAARAYAGRDRVMPVVVVRVGDRFVILNPVPPPTSEWAFAMVFSRRFEAIAGFTY